MNREVTDEYKYKVGFMPAGEAGEKLSYCMTGSVIKIMMILLFFLLFKTNFYRCSLLIHVVSMIIARPV